MKYVGHDDKPLGLSNYNYSLAHMDCARCYLKNDCSASADSLLQLAVTYSSLELLPLPGTISYHMKQLWLSGYADGLLLNTTMTKNKVTKNGVTQNMNLTTHKFHFRQ